MEEIKKVRGDFSHVVVVGGTGRNVGKTEFVCRLIAQIAQAHPVFCLKVSAIYPNEMQFHGDHEKMKPDFKLFEEYNRISHKDTARMLRAGAQRVFFLVADDERIAQGFADFLRKIPEKCAVVCESNSLDQFVRPGLRVMIKTEDGGVKDRARAALDRADIIITSDGQSGFEQLQRISYSPEQGWSMTEQSG